MIDVKFDVIDLVEEEEAKKLVYEINQTDGNAKISQLHPASQGVIAIGSIVAIVTLTIFTVSSIAVIIAFIYSVFRRGVILDLTKSKPQIKKSNDLPRGSLLILYKDGKQELKEGLSAKNAAELIKKVIEGIDV